MARSLQVYDRNGNRVTMTEQRPEDPEPEVVAVTFSTYDDLDRLVSVVRDDTAPFDGTDGEELAYAYDPAGNLIHRGYPDATGVDYEFDGAGRLRAVEAPDGRTEYGYDGGFLDEVVYPESSGLVESRTWDPAGRLTGITTRDVTDQVVARSVLELDDVGNPQQVTDSFGVKTFHHYDERDQLVRSCVVADCPDPQVPAAVNDIGYEYDAAGNRIAEQRPAGETLYEIDLGSDRLLARLGLGGDASYSYDDRGNVTNDGRVLYRYDLTGRMDLAIPYREVKSYWYRIADAHPRAWWRLGETDGGLAFDASGYGRDLVYGLWGSPPTKDQRGLLIGDTDRAVHFDGTQHVLGGWRPDFTDRVTVEAWIRPDDPMPSGEQTVVSFGVDGASDVVSLRIDDDGHLLFVTPEGTVATDGASGPIEAETTHHVVATHDPDGETLRLFVDGSEVAVESGVGDLGIAPDGGSTFLGRGLNLGFYEGVLDDVAVYEEPLSAGRIGRHHQSGTTQTIERLLDHDVPLAWWRLAEPSGMWLADATGNGHDGVGVYGVTTPTLGVAPLNAPEWSDRAAHFDGTLDLVAVTNPPELASGSFSIEAWIAPDGDSNDTDMTIYGQHQDATPGGNLSLRVRPEGILRLDFGGSHLDTTSNAGSYDEINHVVATYDDMSSTVRLYVDGDEVASGSAGPFTGDGASLAFVGAHHQESFKRFHGILDDVAVYAHVLSDAAIGRHHDRGTSPLGPSWLDWVHETYNYDGDGTRIGINHQRAPLLQRHWTVDEILPHGQLVAETDGHGNLIGRWTWGHDRLTETTTDSDRYLLADQLGSILATTSTAGDPVATPSYEPYGTDQHVRGHPGTFGYTGEYGERSGCITCGRDSTTPLSAASPPPTPSTIPRMSRTSRPTRMPTTGPSCSSTPPGCGRRDNVLRTRSAATRPWTSSSRAFWVGVVGATRSTPRSSSLMSTSIAPPM